MKHKTLLLSILSWGVMFMFLTGCYTQLSTVKKTNQDYENQDEGLVYEEEYQEDATGYQEEGEEAPLVYNYNFYGYPYGYDYYSPFYSGLSISIGFGDPWFYSPFYYDPFYNVGYYHHYWNPYRYWGYYSGYPYYGGYPYYYSGYPYYGGYYYPGNVAIKPQQRRDFDHRRGLTTNRGRINDAPYIPSVASGKGNISRVERIRKGDKITTGDRIQQTSTGNSPTIRTRKSDEINRGTITSRPIQRIRTNRTPINTQTKGRTITPRTTQRTRINTGQQPSKSTPVNIQSRSNSPRYNPVTRTKKRSTVKQTPRKVYTPIHRSNPSSSGKTYKPRTTIRRSSPSIHRTPSSKPSTKSTSGKSSSPRRKKK